MNNQVRQRPFGDSDLRVSEVGFGAWGIGGPSMAGDIPIGWGEVDDSESIRALNTAIDQGITFFDTADVYGLGHSEALIGATFGNRSDVIIASKVGHRVDESGAFIREYNRSYIVDACERSLKRLRRDAIDYYQLHSARVEELERGECVEAMDSLQREGKIRYWGASLNTFDPWPEAEFVMQHGLGHGLQIVLNIINQRARDLIERADQSGYGVIARMPLQFGLLTGKFNRDTRFDRRDHRHGRLTPEVIAQSMDELEPVWQLAARLGIEKEALALSFVLSSSGVSTVIPGIKTPKQAVHNTTGLVELQEEDMRLLHELYDSRLEQLLEFMQAAERS